ncbi:MAG: SDR family oxidoreductase [Ectothiorhodospiraceae bacterium]|nr:SDR family oxidoreductase [Ectothiorhodospiraceae bacterium]MCH8503439.1 SDR family oxidoreductase [Ectothiorhodospiraceae bacterium]
MNILVVGASKGLGRAFAEGLGRDGDCITGVSRRQPDDLVPPPSVGLQWIEADMASPREAVDRIERDAPARLDAIIYNLGIWEAEAFSDDYAFLETSDDSVMELVNVNITGTILLLKRLIPRLLQSPKPQVLLTGSTSGLRQSGRPEVAFGASKFALTGIADTLREGFRDQRLAVTCLQPGYLNTDDGLSVPLGDAVGRGEGHLVPVHDVVGLVRSVLDLSSASFVRELVLPAILDERY